MMAADTGHRQQRMIAPTAERSAIAPVGRRRGRSFVCYALTARLPVSAKGCQSPWVGTRDAAGDGHAAISARSRSTVAGAILWGPLSHASDFSFSCLS